MAVNNVYPWYELAWDVAFSGLTDQEILNLFNNEEAGASPPSLQPVPQVSAHKQISEELWADIVQGKVLVYGGNGLPIRNSQLSTLLTHGSQTAHITVDGGQAWLKSRGYLFDWRPIGETLVGPNLSNRSNTVVTKRRDSLTPLIEQAQRECNDPHDTSEVWNKLSVFAHKRVAPFFGVAQEGLKYLDDRGDVQFFAKAALGKRLNRRR